MCLHCPNVFVVFFIIVAATIMESNGYKGHFRVQGCLLDGCITQSNCHLVFVVQRSTLDPHYAKKMCFLSQIRYNHSYQFFGYRFCHQIQLIIQRLTSLIGFLFEITIINLIKFLSEKQ
jgi:hypothetical protein